MAPREVIYLRCRAPFAAYREGGCGSKGVAPTMTPSAAYGLVCSLLGLNIGAGQSADIEVSISQARGMKASWLLHHRHVYVQTPSSESVKARMKTAQKIGVRPLLVPYLSGLDAVVGVRGAPETIATLRRSLAGDLPASHNGSIPFAGDSELLFSHIEECTPTWSELLTWTPAPRGEKGLRLLSTRGRFRGVSEYVGYALRAGEPAEGAWVAARTEGVR